MRALAWLFPISLDQRLACPAVAEPALWQCLLPEEKSPDWAAPVAAPVLDAATDQGADLLAKVRGQPKLAPAMALMCLRMAGFRLIPVLAAQAAAATVKM